MVDESAAVVNSQKMLAEKITIVCDAVSHFSDERKFVGYVEEVRSRGLQELSVLLDGLSKLRENRSGSEVVTATVVRLGLEDGRTVRFSTNRYRKIGILELERFLNKKVVSIQAPELLGGGFREMKTVNGYVNCPPLGWGNSVYRVITESLPGKFGLTSPFL